MATVTVREIEMFYEVRGSGQRLLFVNGSGGTLQSAKPLIDRFAAPFEVLAHDQRGLGNTSVPEEQPTMADYAADIAALLDHVGWQTCRVVGVSFGGMVAQEFAATWPDRVERLALMCTSPGGAGGSSYPLHALAEMPLDERAATSIRIADTRYTPEWLADHPFDQRLVDVGADRRGADKTERQQRGAAMQLEARRLHDVWDRLHAITCPTLVAGGRYDGIAAPANSEAIASRIPDAELRLYEGGHMFMWQDRAAMPEILAFLGGG